MCMDGPAGLFKSTLPLCLFRGLSFFWSDVDPRVPWVESGKRLWRYISELSTGWMGRRARNPDLVGIGCQIQIELYSSPFIHPCDLMAQRLAHRAEDREVKHFQSHPRLTFQSCSRFPAKSTGMQSMHQNPASVGRILVSVSNNRHYYTPGFLFTCYVFFERDLYSRCI